MRKLAFIFVAFGLLVSCTTYHFEPIPGGDIRIISERGSSYPVYVDESIGMIIAPEYAESELMVKVTVKNLSSQSITLNDSDFSVAVSDDKYSWKELKVYTSTEFYKKEKSEYTAGAVIMALGAVSDSYNAGRGYSSTSGTVYGNSTYGSYYGSYNSSTSYYDPVAAELATQRNAQMISNYAQNGKQWLTFLENNLFYQVDLEPGEDYFGLVFAEKGSGRYYRIVCKNSNIKLISIEYERVAD